MIELAIPGRVVLTIRHLILDYNGTLAMDGDLIAGVVERLNILAKSVKLHVLTADTHGTVRDKVEPVNCQVHVIGDGEQDKKKAEYLNSLGADCVVAIGNGRNDAAMLSDAALGISVLQNEGMSPMALTSSDICCKDINDALELLLKPARMTATLRN